MAQRNCADTLDDYLAPLALAVEEDLALWLVESQTPTELAQAMRYCVLGGGKRLRPALVLLTAQSLGASPDDELARRCAAAVEYLHTYSLVHDDLPAMDDDTLRRGRPTAHVQFGEAMAVLAGDALLTRAFGVIAESPRGPVRELTLELARAGGCAGMIAGQVADMGLCAVAPGAEGADYIHARKTAALIRAAARMGAIAAGASQAQLAAIGDYGLSLGLAFQLVDDLLDVSGQAAQLGKTPGKDAHAGKRTHASEIGLDASRRLAGKLTRRAVESLAPLGGAGEQLARLAQLLADRTH
jgi:geranylgeranyl pyrophosphate synthase